MPPLSPSPCHAAGSFLRRLAATGCLALAVVLTAPARVPALVYVTDRNVYVPPDYFTFLPPPSGGSYLDPVFHTAIKRLSNALATPDPVTGGTLTWITNEYSTMSPFSKDNSWLLVLHQSHFALYDGEGNYLRDLPREISNLSEPRWSRRNPNVFFYITGNQLKRFHVVSGASTVVRTFSEYSRITGNFESDVGFRQDLLVLTGDWREIFVYDAAADTKGPVLDATGHGFDQLYLTPDDHVLVGWYERGRDRFQGEELFDRDMRFLRQVATAVGHMDVTRDANGEDVLLWADAADLDPPPECVNGIVKIRLSDAARTCLITFDWSLGFHVSAPDGGGWFFVGTVAPSDPGPLGGWTAYTDEILQVRLDGSEVRRLAHHRSRPFNEYNWFPRAAISRDGTRVVYSSNYGLQAILGFPTQYSDVYLITDVQP